MKEMLCAKRIEILEAIKPYCDVFGIEDYDYIINADTGSEKLKLNDTYIGCTGNSTLAVIDEIIGYVFVKRFCKNRYIGAFSKQTINAITQYWIKGGVK